MSTIDTGGPAFPVSTSVSSYAEAGLYGHQDGSSTWQFGGLTMRDYFAATADISADMEEDGAINERLARNLMDGVSPPSWDSDFVAARVWWAEAEARLRYMKADAMLRARNQP